MAGTGVAHKRGRLCNAQMRKCAGGRWARWQVQHDMPTLKVMPSGSGPHSFKLPGLTYTYSREGSFSHSAGMVPAVPPGARRARPHGTAQAAAGRACLGLVMLACIRALKCPLLATTLVLGN